MNKDAYITGSDIILHAIMYRLQAERIKKLRSCVNILTEVIENICN